MAEEEKKNIEEEQEEQEVVQKKSFPVKLIVIAVLVLALLGGGFFVLKGRVLSKPSKNVGVQSLEEGGTGQEMGPIYSLDNFIVNLVGGRGKNYLKARLELEMNDYSAKAEIDKRMPQLRDIILTILSSKSNEDVKSLEGKFQLRAELISSLNQCLRNGKIVNVYFTEFIVQ